METESLRIINDNDEAVGYLITASGLTHGYAMYSNNNSHLKYYNVGGSEFKHIHEKTFNDHDEMIDLLNTILTGSNTYKMDIFKEIIKLKNIDMDSINVFPDKSYEDRLFGSRGASPIDKIKIGINYRVWIKNIPYKIEVVIVPVVLFQNPGYVDYLEILNSKGEQAFTHQVKSYPKDKAKETMDILYESFYGFIKDNYKHLLPNESEHR